MQYPFRKPLPAISSPFGWRMHPITKQRKHHNGTDFAVPVGRKVYAVAPGKVIYAGPSTLKFKNGEPAGGGYIVRILFRLGLKFYTATYMHLKKNSIVVDLGEKVKQDQLLAESGDTGESTGPHLHFEIQAGKKYVYTNDGSRYLEPMKFIKQRLDK